MKKKWQSIREFIFSTTQGKTLTFGVVLLLLALLPVTILAVHTTTQTQQHADTNCPSICTQTEQSCISTCKTDCQNKYTIDKDEIACENRCTTTSSCISNYTSCNNSCNAVTCNGTKIVCTGSVIYRYTTCSNGTITGPQSSQSCTYGCNATGDGCQPKPTPIPTQSPNLARCVCDKSGDPSDNKFYCLGSNGTYDKNNPYYCADHGENGHVHYKVPCFNDPTHGGTASCGTPTGKAYCPIPFITGNNVGGANAIYSGNTTLQTESHYYCANDEFCFNDATGTPHCAQKDIPVTSCNTPNNTNLGENWFSVDIGGNRTACSAGVACNNINISAAKDNLNDKNNSSYTATVTCGGVIQTPPSPTSGQQGDTGGSGGSGGTGGSGGGGGSGGSGSTDNGGSSSGNAGSTPSPSPLPTPAKTVITLVLGFPGIGFDGPVGSTPKHLTRTVHVELYDGKVTTPSAPGTHPIAQKDSIVTFDQGSDNNAGYFVSLPITINLPSTPPANDQYKILVKVPQYLYALAINPTVSNTSDQTIFTITTEDPLILPPLTLFPGDIATGNGSINVIDINDYTLLKSCYDTPSSCPTTPDGVMYADLDDNGVIDVVDFNNWLRSISQLQQENTSVCTSLSCRGE